MADLDDLDYKSILNMENDEAVELLRQIRLNRRTAVTAPKTRTITTKRQKAPTVSEAQAAELLRLLGGK